MATIVRGKRVLLPDGIQPAEIWISNEGIITKIITGDAVYSKNLSEEESKGELIEAGDLLVMSGLVDSHVHCNEPGRTEWEGFKTATAAAAKGGATTIVDMPLNSIPSTTSVEALNEKARVAQGQTHVDVAFWGGFVPDNIAHLRPLLSAGVVGFKCFMCPSGVDEFPHVTLDQIQEALDELDGTGGLLAFHAELEPEEVIEVSGDPCEFETFERSRCSKWETRAVTEIVKIISQRKYRPTKPVRTHIVHVSSAECLEVCQKFNISKEFLTLETCPHYLTLRSEKVPRGATEYKCCPPIRNKINQDRLWDALNTSSFSSEYKIDCVVSDHSPCTPKLKAGGNFLEAWGGIASVQLRLSLFWTEARKRGFTFQDVNRLLSSEPARLCNLYPKKGNIGKGADGDLVIWDPEEAFTVTEETILHKHKVTPYLGMELQGVVKRTIIRGKTVYEEKKGLTLPSGQLILSKLLC